MQRLIPVVLIHYDRRGTRVLLSHPLAGPVARIPAEPAEDATAAGLARRHLSDTDSASQRPTPA